MARPTTHTHGRLNRRIERSYWAGGHDARNLWLFKCWEERLARWLERTGGKCPKCLREGR